MKTKKVIDHSKEIYQKSIENEDGFFSLIIDGSEIRLLNHPHLNNPESALIIFNSERFFLSKGVFKNLCIDYNEELNVNFETPCVITFETENQSPHTINVLFNALVLSLKNSKLFFEHSELLETMLIYFADGNHEYLYSYYFYNMNGCIQKISGDQKIGEMIIKTLLHSKEVISWEKTKEGSSHVE